MTNYGPINASTFDDCLARGFGRVVLFLRENDDKPFRDSILHACGHNLAFDKQCEDTREVYLCDILEATAQLDFYSERVLDMLRTDDDDYSYTQLYGLAGQMAARGNEHAREVMYEHVQSDFDNGYSTGADALVELDGVQGYLHVIRAALRNKGGPRDEYFSEYLLLEKAYDRDGVEKAQSAIKDAADSDTTLRDYLVSIDTQWREWKRKIYKRDSDSILTYAMLRTLIDDQTKPFEISEWWGFGKQATTVALDRLARDLEFETDKVTLLKIIALFRRRDFRGDIEPLLGLAISTDDRLSREARRMLSKMPDENVRKFGLNLVEERTRLLVGLDMLERSGRVSEYPLFRELLNSDYSDDDFHQLGIRMRAVIEHNPSPHALPILEQLYERGRCSMCRSSTIERMIDCETVPDWVSAEAVFDAEAGTRKMAREWIEGRDSRPGP